MPTLTPKHLDRFHNRITWSLTGCLLWHGDRDNKGYGHVWADRKLHLAHRAFYETFIGPIPDGLKCDHLCRVRNCINPNHIELVTDRENILRGIGAPAMNARKTHCKYGHPLTGDNLFIYKRYHHRYRVCIECRRANNRRYHYVRKHRKAQAKKLDARRKETTGE